MKRFLQLLPFATRSYHSLTRLVRESGRKKRFFDTDTGFMVMREGDLTANIFGITVPIVLGGQIGFRCRWTLNIRGVMNGGSCIILRNSGYWKIGWSLI